MAQKFINAGRFELLSDLTSGATTINLLAAGALLPVASVGTGPLTSGDWFKLVLQDGGSYEVVAVRSHASGSDQMTNVLRGQEGTTAQAWPAGTVIGNRWTAGDADALSAAVAGKVDAVAGKGLSTEDYTTVEKGKLAGVAANANNYTHPSTDGSLHVPATGTTNSGKVLKAGATAGSAAWAVLVAADVGLGNANNTADVDKPVSTAQQALFDTKAQLATPTITGLREVRVDLSTGSAINLASGNLFIKTLTGTTTFTISNVPANGTVAAFILVLTNAGGKAITWWSTIKWAGGTAPTLTTTGVNWLGFITYDGGSTWTGFAMGLDVK